MCKECHHEEPTLGEHTGKCGERREFTGSKTAELFLVVDPKSDCDVVVEFHKKGATSEEVGRLSGIPGVEGHIKVEAETVSFYCVGSNGSKTCKYRYRLIWT